MKTNTLKLSSIIEHWNSSFLIDHSTLNKSDLMTAKTRVHELELSA